MMTLCNDGQFLPLCNYCYH